MRRPSNRWLKVGLQSALYRLQPLFLILQGSELQVDEGLVSQSEAEECTTSEFNPVRAGFFGGKDVWTRDVLNLGIRPDKIIAKVGPIWEL